MDGITTLWQSRKFRILIYDATVSLVLLIGSWYLAPDALDKLTTVIGILQAPILAVIGGIAYEDGKEKGATVIHKYGADSAGELPEG